MIPPNLITGAWQIVAMGYKCRPCRVGERTLHMWTLVASKNLKLGEGFAGVRYGGKVGSRIYLRQSLTMVFNKI